jgi:hypothetical protein
MKMNADPKYQVYILKINTKIEKKDILLIKSKNFVLHVFWPRLLPSNWKKERPRKRK